MKRTFLILATTISGLAMSYTSQAQVFINEVMQSNIDCIMDDLNDFPDSWVELYNGGSGPVNLSEYSLGTSEDASKAWPLPNHSLAKGAYKIVYCDKVGSGWHTDYRLESGKDCSLYLFRNGSVVDQLPSGMKKQPASNVAYGRKTDGADKWGYQLDPTPGRANTGEVCTNKDILPLPQFSSPGRVFRPGQQVRLVITVPADAPEGTQIRYTLDGSEPTMESPLYSGAMRFSESTVVRAKLFCDGYLSPRALTHSYICADHDISLPIVSITTDERYLYDDGIGIYVNGNNGQPNFQNDWRRPMNFEVFDGNQAESCVNQLGEARITGGATREYPLKSLGIYANKRFGEKRFIHEFFPEQRPGQKDFKSLMLRNAGNDYYYLYMRDAIIQTHMAKYMDLDYQAYRPAVVYINGQYKGMLNIRERSNEDNIYTNYNGLEDICMVENWSELKEGDYSMFLQFKDFYAGHAHTYADYNQIMDVQEYMNVMILNMFFNNIDFPGNNIVWWRPIADGGRWRVLVKDTDFGLGLYGRSVDYKIFEWMYNNSHDPDNAWGNTPDATRLFRRLMEDTDFKREFIDRFAIYMGDYMNLDRTWSETWKPMYEAIKDEYPHHIAVNTSWVNYENETGNAKNWLKGRVPRIYNQLSEFFGLGAVKTLKIRNALAENSDRAISFNGVGLSKGTFDGSFFAGRQITLKGEDVVAWQVSMAKDDGTTTELVEGSTLALVIPDDCNGVVITAKSDAQLDPDDEVVVPDWVNILKNGGADYDFSASVGCKDDALNFTISAWGKERQGNPHPADIMDEDGNRVFVVHAADCVNPAEDASAWDNQFWIQAPREFRSGDEIKVTFRYKASQKAKVNTQVHRQTPGNYLHWEAIGDVHFTTDWQTYERTITVNDRQDGMWSVAFNLNSEIKTATNFWFDDLQWIVVKDANSHRRGDVNGDGDVDVTDLNIVIDVICGENTPAETDMNADGVTDITDMNIIIDIIIDGN